MPGSTANPTSAPAQRRQLSIARYLRDSRIELKKVTWPTREQTINLTIVVCVVCVAISLFLGGLDWIFAEFIKLLAGS
ncbi:MAG: preprotein translocase subunit SecE [Chloroflexota bacterium]|jgi:preprotein translocase subunit SecE